MNGYCHICGEEIMGNADPSRVLECGMCVQRRVKHIERIELESGMNIKNKEEYLSAVKKAKENPMPPTRKSKPKALRASGGVKRAKFSTEFQSTDLLLRWEDQLNE